jgi:hypothetical protein
MVNFFSFIILYLNLNNLILCLCDELIACINKSNKYYPFTLKKSFGVIKMDVVDCVWIEIFYVQLRVYCLCP